jgi:nucleoside-diphosphate-sugar epimerase
MINILITGGAGNVGSALANKLLNNKEYYIVVVDNLRTGSLDKLPNSNSANFKFFKADVNNYLEIESIMRTCNFQYVFHYAALVGVQRTLDNPLDVLKDIEGFKNILELSKETSVKKVFFSSSSEVYGEPVEFPQNEITTPLNAKLPYAIVKNVGEAYLKSYFKEYGLKYTIFRFFNTYGPAQSKDFVIKKFITQALSNEDITIYGNGSQTRTFCFIDDNIDVTIKIFENNLMDNEILNIGNTNETSVLELANLIISLTNSKSNIIHLPALVEGDMTRRLPDNSIMLSILNRELLPLNNGILKIINN